jgi:hypothetical protein
MLVQLSTNTWVADNRYGGKSLYGASRQDSRGVLIACPPSGHDEYWSKEQSDTVEAHVDGGGSVAFLSGNTLWWQVRFEDVGHTMVCYKSTALVPLTRTDTARVTVNWHDAPVFRPPARLMGVDVVARLELPDHNNGDVMRSAEMTYYERSRHMDGLAAAEVDRAGRRVVSGVYFARAWIGRDVAQIRFSLVR